MKLTACCQHLKVLSTITLHYHFLQKPVQFLKTDIIWGKSAAIFSLGWYLKDITLWTMTIRVAPKLEIKDPDYY